MQLVFRFLDENAEALIFDSRRRLSTGNESIHGNKKLRTCSGARRLVYRSRSSLVRCEIVHSITNLSEDVPASALNHVLFHSYLAEYEAIQSAASDDVEKFVGNPLNSYRLIKKMTSDWKEVKEVITSNSGEALVQNLTGLADFKVGERPICIKSLRDGNDYTSCLSLLLQASEGTKKRLGVAITYLLRGIFPNPK